MTTAAAAAAASAVELEVSTRPRSYLAITTPSRITLFRSEELITEAAASLSNSDNSRLSLTTNLQALTLQSDSKSDNSNEDQSESGHIIMVY